MKTVFVLKLVGLVFLFGGFVVELFGVHDAHMWGIFCAANLMLCMMGYGAWKGDADYALR